MAGLREWGQNSEREPSVGGDRLDATLLQQALRQRPDGTISKDILPPLQCQGV